MSNVSKSKSSRSVTPPLPATIFALPFPSRGLVHFLTSSPTIGVTTVPVEPPSARTPETLPERRGRGVKTDPPKLQRLAHKLLARIPGRSRVCVVTDKLPSCSLPLLGSCPRSIRRTRTHAISTRVIRLGLPRQRQGAAGFSKYLHPSAVFADDIAGVPSPGEPYESPVAAPHQKPCLPVPHHQQHRTTVRDSGNHHRRMFHQLRTEYASQYAVS